MTKNQIVDRIIECGAVAVIRMEDSEKLIRVVNAIHTGGIDAIEITMTVPNALKSIEDVSKKFGENVLVGVGSVLNKKMTQEAIDAGAKYVVSPILKEEIVNTAHKNNLPAMPGCFTPTEIQTAFEMGADIIKVFPADVLGMEFFKGVKAPMPHLRLMPTGGVTLTNAGEWLSAGACAVGVGSALLDKKSILENNYDQLTLNAQLLMKTINNYRNKITHN